MKIYVGLPQGLGVNHGRLTEWLCALPQLAPHHTFIVKSLERVQFVGRARAILTHHARAMDCDALCMIDADQIPKQNSHRLFDADGDVVSGFTVMLRENQESKKYELVIPCGRTEPHTFRGITFDEARAAGDGYVDLDYCGSGCILIRREVLEDRRMLVNPEYVDAFGIKRDVTTQPDEPAPFWDMRLKPNGSINVGEDIGFTLRASRLGYRVRLLMGARFGHEKPVDMLRFCGIDEEDF